MLLPEQQPEEEKKREEEKEKEERKKKRGWVETHVTPGQGLPSPPAPR